VIPVDREEKRRSILRAALAVFSRRGYERATISDIAAEARIGKGVVYDYFRSKEELFADLFDFLFPQEDAALAAAIAAAPGPVEEIAVVAGAVLRHYESLGGYFNVVAQFWAQGQSENAGPRFNENWARLFTSCRSRVADSVRRAMAAGLFRPDLDPDAAAWAVIAVLDGSILQWLHSRGGQSLSERGLAALQVLLRGMASAEVLSGAAGGLSFGRPATERSVIGDGRPPAP